jgi:CubicO group peptidase (beta-lactamase class C family)
MRAAVVVSTFIAVAAAGVAAAQNAAPGAHGFSADGLAALDAYFAEQVENGVRAGYVIGIARDGELVHSVAVGMADIEAGRPMALDTTFRLASMSKPVTIVAALTLVDQGKLDLDDPVSVYIPTVANMLVATSPTKNADGAFDLVPPDPPMTVRNLMTHTSGMSYTFGGPSDLDREWAARNPFTDDVDLKGAIDEITWAPLHFQPGERWLYGVSIDVLGRVVEVAAGMPFEQYLQTAIFDPLGMDSTHFYLEPGQRDEVATIYGNLEDGSFARIETLIFGTGDEAWPSGGGGLFSTMPDYLKLASMLANDGALGDVRILSPEAVALMREPQLSPEQYPLGPDGAPGTLLGWSPEGRNFGLGVQVTSDAALTPQVDRNGDFGWNGAYATDWFASPSTGVAAVIMLASSGPNRPPQNVGIDLRQYVYGALEE